MTKEQPKMIKKEPVDYWDDELRAIRRASRRARRRQGAKYVVQGILLAIFLVILFWGTRG